MLARIAGEIEEKQTFIDGIVEAAENEHRDLSSQEMEMVTRSRDRQSELNAQAGPMQEAARIALESRERIMQIGKLTGDQPEKSREVSYRSAGEYVLDQWRSGLGDGDASRRLEMYNRAASHQTTADSPGLIPTPIVGPVVDFIDASRPLVTALGPRQLPGQNWSRPKVTQHTTVGVQSGEKAELTSQKMTITKLTGTAVTYGGYVNVSRQSVDFTQPGVMDIVIQDLAGQYAIQTEQAASTTFAAAATAGATLPTGANTADQVAGALWAAAALIYTGTKGIGKVFAVVPPGLLGAWGSLFAPYGPMNQQGQGFSAANFSTGLAGVIAGIPVYVSTAVAANTALVLSSAAAECYEERIGSLQVVEPSVLGVQVAYAGYFTPMVIEPTGIIKITKTP
jgi:HK97 family phage major capsid protein